MTVTTDTAVECDGDPGMAPFECPTPPIHATTRSRALALARARGWRRARRDGRTVDICPEHQT